MPRITQILQAKRRENRRNIFLDGKFAFGCNVNVVARFRLQPGMDLSAEQLHAIEFGEVKQECFDKAMDYLSQRLHSRAEIVRKLTRFEYGPNVIAAVLEDLARLNYLDDARYARTKAQSSADHKKHGKRRAFVDLMRAGVKGDVAEEALRDVYTPAGSIEIARKLAMKQAPRLRRLDPAVARRRLTGMLQRRGFDYESIRPVIDEVLNCRDDDFSDA
jgi:regulatory protein